MCPDEVDDLLLSNVPCFSGTGTGKAVNPLCSVGLPEFK